jgi:hypothetical protein
MRPHGRARPHQAAILIQKQKILTTVIQPSESRGNRAVREAVFAGDFEHARRARGSDEGAVPCSRRDPTAPEREGAASSDPLGARFRVPGGPPVRPSVEISRPLLPFSPSRSLVVISASWSLSASTWPSVWAARSIAALC